LKNYAAQLEKKEGIMEMKVGECMYTL